MSRSKWKGPYIDLKFFKSNFKIQTRNSIILPKFLNNIVYIYNGKTFIKLKIQENMIGYRFGEFSITKQPFKYKKK